MRVNSLSPEHDRAGHAMRVCGRRRYRLKLRPALTAVGFGEFTPFSKAASWHQFDLAGWQPRYLTCRDLVVCPKIRDRSEQPARIGMNGPRQDIHRGSLLGHLPGVKNDDPVCDRRDHTDVVSDEHDRDAFLALNLADELAMTFAISRGIPAAGLAFAATMMIGVAVTLSAVSIVAVLFRQQLVHLLQSRLQLVAAVSRAIEAVAGFVLVAIAVHEIMMK